MFHGGEELRGREQELPGDVVVRDHHHLHPGSQPGRHAVGSVLEHQAGGRLGTLCEPVQTVGWGDVWTEELPGGAHGEYLRGGFGLGDLTPSHHVREQREELAMFG